MNKARIAAALRALADAVEDSGIDTAKVISDAKINKADDEAREAMQKARDEPKAAEPETVEEVTLEDLQELGGNLLRAKKRDEFKAVLKQFKLANLSAAKKDQYAEVYKALQEVIA